MTNPDTSAERVGIFLPPGKGRSYAMGRIGAVFKADGDETAGRYAISEWWLEPHTQGPGAHAHEEDDVFYVIEGTMSILLGNRWIDAPRARSSWRPAGSATISRTGARRARVS